MILFGSHDHAVKIARAAGTGFDPDINYVLSRVGPQLLGGVIYTNYTKRSVMAHIAGFVPGWLSRELMWTMYDFPFNQLKVERIFVTVPTTNERSLLLAEKMGFAWVVTIPNVVVGGDMDVLSMSRVGCRWLKLAARFSQAMENAA